MIVTFGFSGGLNSFAFVNGNKALIPLGPLNSTPLIIRAFDSPAKCRTSCTIPKCGDGILDGGEVCDDGNTNSGDGCSSNCKSLVLTVGAPNQQSNAQGTGQGAQPVAQPVDLAA